MNIKTKETYSEVYSILNMLGGNYITKLPSKLYQMIKEEKSDEYNPQYDSKISLDRQNIKKETLSMIALFHLNYWCNSLEEKQELQDLFNKNEIEKREKYNPDYLFKNKLEELTSENNDKTPENNTNTALVKYKESFFIRFKKFIFKILHINK